MWGDRLPSCGELSDEKMPVIFVAEQQQSAGITKEVEEKSKRIKEKYLPKNGHGERQTWPFFSMERKE